MAKIKVLPADHLTMDLFAPGMSPLHRAGLGGLACTLKSIERSYDDGRIKAARLPAPFKSGQPPWEITDRSVSLRFGEPRKAGDFLQKLFEIAFSIRKDGLIFLPGQYRLEPSAAVLADLQLGMVLTFLQHGQVRKLAKEPTLVTHDPDGDASSAVTVEYHKCGGFKHQSGWESFVQSRGTLTAGHIKIDGPISPGTAVRHVAFTADTTAKDPPERMLPLYFALVGCLALAVNRGVAALLVPEVVNLQEFIYDRPAMTPTTARECQIANAADAALQAQIRIRGRQRISGSAIPGCYAMTFMPTAWASQQKSRVATIHIPAGDDRRLDRFQRALAYLPTRIVTQKAQTQVPRGGKKKSADNGRGAFRAESVIRPLIAENLALDRPWYADFSRLMTRVNPATNKPYRDQLQFERKELHDMMNDKNMWDEEGEALMVKAIHEGIRQTLGRIREETDGNSGKPLSQATKNRWERFRDKLRLDLAGAKTESHVRFVLTDLFSRGGSNSVLREHWSKVLPVIRRDWHLARDLGLLALASYVGKGEPKEDSAGNQ